MSNDTAIISLKEKIDDLNQQAWEVRVTDLPKAFELSQESVKLARGINYPKGLAEGLRSLGFSYVRFFKNDEAAPLLKESLSLFQSLNDLKGQAVIYEYLGIIERNWGNLGASLDLLLKANELILQTGPPEIEITCSYQLGVTYKHLGDHDNALDYLYKTLSLAKKINFPLMEAYATNIIGSIYFDNGNYNEALDCYQQGLIVRQQSHDKWGEAGSLDNIGFTYLKLNDLDKAIEYCKQSLAICQDTGDKKGEANALLHLGEIYEQAGDIKQAAGFSNESLEIRKARGDKRGETEVLLFLADLYKNRNDVEDHQIFEWLSCALKIADEIKAQDLLSKTHYNLHEYYQQKGNFKESLVQLEAHFQIEKELHKNSINQKIANLEISHKAEVVSQRNKELTELNEKIEKANEELKIEASLERVRTAAMAMKKSEELVIVSAVMFGELVSLGFTNIRNAQIAIENEQRQSFITYVHSDTEQHAIRETPYSSSSLLLKARQNLSTSGAFYQTEYRGKELEEWRMWKKNMGGTLDEKELSATSLQFYLYAIGKGHIGISTFDTITPEQIEIVKRFKNVFELSYQRFDDLQKAEAQAKEAQIQLALERVRARTMAMQRSDELRETVLVIYEQLQQLNFDSKACNIIIIDRESGSAQYWVSGFSQEIFPESYMVPYLDHPYFDALLNPWKQGDKYVVYEYTGQMKQSFDELFFTKTEFRNIPEEAKKVMIGLKSVKLSTAFISYGAIQSMGAEPLSEEKANILKRFAKVFEQTYTRFLDFKKAEAQTREAKIEVALEKVRSRSLAMHKSDEIEGVLHTVFERLKELEIEFYTAIIILFEKNTKDIVWWLESRENKLYPKTLIPYGSVSYLRDLFDARENGHEHFSKLYSFEEKNELFHHLFDHTDFKYVSEQQKKFLLETESYSLSVALAKNTAIHITRYSGKSFSEQDNEIFKRFARVFEQAYTRFLDLQKAEAQARESQIEAALEKVRSRSLAMHTANELGEVVTVIVEKLKDLGVVLDANGVVLCTYFQNSKNVMHWIVSPDYSMAGHYLLPYFDHPIFNVAWQSKENGDEYFSKAFSVEEKNSFFKHAFEHSDYRHFPDELKQWIFQNDQHILSFAWQKNSAILIPSHTGVLPSEEDVAILKRFSKVFEQSYVRFLDLQKAEAQTRESQIQLALERVRARTMAMQKSEELKEVAHELRVQLAALGTGELETCAINLYEEYDEFVEAWAAVRPPDSAKDIFEFHFQLPKKGIYIIEDMLHAYASGAAEFVFELEGQKGIQWMKKMEELVPEMFAAATATPDFKITGNVQAFFSCHYFSGGSLIMITMTPPQEESRLIMKRCTQVFGHAYRRFADLKKAEAQAREAQIEAALERIRSRTMAMQKSEELKDVIQVVYEQFVHLNVHVEHTGFIMDYKERNDMHIWLADKHAVPFQVTLPYFDCAHWNSFNEAKEKGIDFFANKLSFEEKNKFYQDLFKLIPGLPEETLKYYFSCPGLAISTVLLDNVGLYIENFSGIPYSDEENATLMRFGKVFQQTYTRFNDLKLAEAHAVQAEEDLVKLQTEKKRAEDALSELQVTQKQLIQSEKMASLGELTAGIAHEIQNPLNFVNNFSDVNKELLVEMKEEIEKGNIEEVKLIANDIISNEEKINHHGKRADAIVKGMLQHSRSSSGVKEPTDINELADEYLRLAYHGLRAKDKSFNAIMKTDFDQAVGKVNVIPQDIGRVFLNLITNAFYVVAEKKKQMPPSPKGGNGSTLNDYEPIVTVTTKRLDSPSGDGGKIEIRVADNGNGIPKKILDKIFQPFFTTKPTGQGTGLGLSLSYDIVKAHSGEIKVKTKDGEGSEFVIQLPVV